MSDGMTRRDATKVIASIPLAVPAIISAAPQQVVFGLIGAGAWGQSLVAHANTLVSGRCAAICDPDEGNLRKAIALSRDSPQPFRDYRQLLARKDIQAVMLFRVLPRGHAPQGAPRSRAGEFRRGHPRKPSHGRRPPRSVQ